jgi:hypothetical protein
MARLSSAAAIIGMLREVDAVVIVHFLNAMHFGLRIDLRASPTCER